MTGGGGGGEETAGCWAMTGWLITGAAADFGCSTTTRGLSATAVAAEETAKFWLTEDGGGAFEELIEAAETTAAALWGTSSRSDCKGATMVPPHFGHGPETPARLEGTLSFALQLGQLNLIFVTGNIVSGGYHISLLTSVHRG